MVSTEAPNVSQFVFKEKCEAFYSLIQCLIPPVINTLNFYGRFDICALLPFFAAGSANVFLGNHYHLLFPRWDI